MESSRVQQSKALTYLSQLSKVWPIQVIKRPHSLRDRLSQRQVSALHGGQHVTRNSEEKGWSLQEIKWLLEMKAKLKVSNGSN